jgi:hypothetical protein
VKLERKLIRSFGNKGEDPMSRLNRLFERLESFESSQDPDIKHLLDILGLRDRSGLVTTVQALQFKYEELYNFYCGLIAVLRLQKGSSLTECIRQVTNLAEHRR